MKRGKLSTLFFSFLGWGLRVTYNSDIFENLRPPHRFSNVRIWISDIFVCFFTTPPLFGKSPKFSRFFNYDASRKETLPGEKTANGTVITGLIPCPKFGDNDGDGGGKDGGDDGGDNGGDDGRDDNECSNEKFGETEEESDGKTSKRQKKYNENCSTYHKNTLKKKK